MAIEARHSAQRGTDDDRLARLVSLAPAILVAQVLLLLSISSSSNVSAEPGDVRALVGQAIVLPPLSAEARRSLESLPASWRDDLIEFDLERRVAARAEAPKQGATDLADALRKAKPAPMAYPDRETLPRSSGTGETIDGHAVGGCAAPRRTSAARDSSSASPKENDLSRQVAGREGESPNRAPPRDSTESAGAYRILLEYIVDGDTVHFVCEATPLGNGEFLTAGHCVYRNPSDEQDTSGARWATRAWVWLAEVEPSAALPVSRLAAHQEWVTRGASDHDFGVVIVPALSPVPGPEGPDLDR